MCSADNVQSAVLVIITESGHITACASRSPEDELSDYQVLDIAVEALQRDKDRAPTHKETVSMHRFETKDHDEN